MEDVYVLLELPCYGQHDLSSIKLSEEEESVYNFFCGLLKDYHRNSGVLRFFTWISLFHCNYNHKKGETSNPLFSNHEHELMALVAMWLARHALPGCPDDGISPSSSLLPIKLLKEKASLLLHFTWVPYIRGWTCTNLKLKSWLDGTKF